MPKSLIEIISLAQAGDMNAARLEAAQAVQVWDGKPDKVEVATAYSNHDLYFISAFQLPTNVFFCFDWTKWFYQENQHQMKGFYDNNPNVFFNQPDPKLTTVMIGILPPDLSGGVFIYVESGNRIKPSTHCVKPEQAATAGGLPILLMGASTQRDPLNCYRFPDGQVRIVLQPFIYQAVK